MRKCRTCHILKVLTDFSKNPDPRYGYRYVCNACDAEAKTQPRQCRKCQEYKSWDKFDRRTIAPDGYDSLCKKCKAPRRAAHYLLNRDDILAQERQRYIDDPGWYGVAALRRFHGNVKKLRAYNNLRARRSKRDPIKASITHWKRRIRLLNAPFEDISLAEIYLRDGGICQICHKKTLPPGSGKWNNSRAATLDHIVPVSHPDFVNVGHVRTNVRLAHKGCNSGRRERAADAQYLLFG